MPGSLPIAVMSRALAAPLAVLTSATKAYAVKPLPGPATKGAGAGNQPAQASRPSPAIMFMLLACWRRPAPRTS